MRTPGRLVPGNCDLTPDQYERKNEANESMKPRKKTQYKAGFVLRENPDCPADQVLDAIIEKRKGKYNLLICGQPGVMVADKRSKNTNP